MHVFRVAEKAPDFRPGVENFLVGGKRPVVINPRDFLAEITGGDRPASGAFIRETRIEAGRDRAPRGAVLRDGLGICEGGRVPRGCDGGEPEGWDAERERAE